MKDGATTGERATTSASTAGRIRRYSVVEGIGERSSIILPHLYKGVERGKHGRHRILAIGNRRLPLLFVHRGS